MKTWTTLLKVKKGAINNWGKRCKLGLSKPEHRAVLSMGDCNTLPNQNKQLC